MKERPDRWRRFRQQPAIHKLTHIRQSRGINGKKLRYKNDRRISVSTRINIFRNYRRSHREIATLGAVGCSLSHIDVWKKFIKTGSRYCFIMEDDAILTESTLDTVNRLIPTLPQKWGIWLLGCYKPTLVYRKYERNPWMQVYKFTASHAYLLTREAAIKLLADAVPIESHVDHYIGDVSILNDTLIVYHPEVHIEFFQKEKVLNSQSTTVDSNTSQHKPSGCPMCKIPDDPSNMYVNPSMPSKDGVRIDALVRDEQPRQILKLKSKTRRKHMV